MSRFMSVVLIIELRNFKWGMYLSVTQIASSQKDFIFRAFLSPERAATYQPRATPWGNVKKIFKPCKGAT